MADIFDVDNQENYEVQEFDNEPSEQDYLDSLETKPHLDGVYSTGLHPSMKKQPDQSIMDDAIAAEFEVEDRGMITDDDFFGMMSQQTWIPEQVEKVKDGYGVLDFGKLQESINMDRHQLEMWGKQSTATDPSHYNSVPADLQHWDVVERMGWGYHVGCATKYIWRAGKKESASLTANEKEIEDLQKAIVYIQKRIDLLTK